MHNDQRSSNEQSRRQRRMRRRDQRQDTRDNYARPWESYSPGEDPTPHWQQEYVQQHSAPARAFQPNDVDYRSDYRAGRLDDWFDYEAGSQRGYLNRSQNEELDNTDYQYSSYENIPYGRNGRRMGFSRGFRGKGPKGYRRSDERLYEEICELFFADDTIDSQDVTVTVKNGEVTLEGSVHSRQMKRAAEELVERVGGVQEIHNKLRSSRSSAGTQHESANKTSQNLENMAEGGSSARPNVTSTSRQGA